MKVVSGCLIPVLVALVALHAYWAFAGRWPGHDERSLVELVVGRTRAMRMPGFGPSMLVAGALFSAAVLVALRRRVVFVDLGAPAKAVARIGFWIVFAVFVLRGLAGVITTIIAYAEELRSRRSIVCSIRRCAFSLRQALRRPGWDLASGVCLPGQRLPASGKSVELGR